MTSLAWVHRFSKIVEDGTDIPLGADSGEGEWGLAVVIPEEFDDFGGGYLHGTLADLGEQHLDDPDHAAPAGITPRGFDIFAVGDPDCFVETVQKIEFLGAREEFSVHEGVDSRAQHDPLAVEVWDREVVGMLKVIH